MDRLERTESPVDAFIAAFEGRQAGMWTAMPGIIESYDPTEMTCTVQLAIQMRVQKQERKV